MKFSSYLETLKKLQNEERFSELKFKAAIALFRLQAKGKHIYQRAKQEFKTWRK